MNFDPKIVQLSRVINTPIINLNGEKIGKIVDFAIYDRNGTIAYLVVEIFDNNLGRKDELFAIPWQAFKMSRIKETTIFTIDDKLLVNAPAFMKEEWFEANQTNLIVAVYKHYQLRENLDAQIEDYNAAASMGVGESGKVSSIKEKTENKTTIERAGINDNKKSYMY